MFKQEAEFQGREMLDSFAIGVIKSIVETKQTNAQKMRCIKEALAAFKQVYEDDTLPYSRLIERLDPVAPGSVE